MKVILIAALSAIIIATAAGIVISRGNTDVQHAFATQSVRVS